MPISPFSGLIYEKGLRAKRETVVKDRIII